MTALIILGWIICSIITYYWERNVHKNKFQHWTNGLMLLVILISLTGPLGLFATALMSFITADFWDNSTSWFNRDSKW